MKNLSKRKLSNDDYNIWTTVFVPNTSREDFNRLLEKMKSGEEQDKSYSFFVEAENEVVGFIQVFNVLRAPSHSGMIEISIAEGKRKQGLGKLAIKLLEDFAFNELKLKRLLSPINKDNAASIALFTSLHYEKAYTDPSAFFFGGKPAPHEIYVKLAP